ncbi:phage terminase small subunit [Saccharopolyspora spinosa]|uniref:Uncharacterized protein n=1 Tax=Saccharopolyspora spinosa TaxID=60894 RepID=A0A2N3Y044_SACSN|nr:phage terminase small subunit [Saccharopolyspora spinosa]PKW16260.1 hypothetical protein A8926_4076 [Saccharopolyspora spinosa]
MFESVDLDDGVAPADGDALGEVVGVQGMPAPPSLLNKLGNGTDSGGRKVSTGPAFRRSASEPPEWLTEEAAAEWHRVTCRQPGWRS